MTIKVICNKCNKNEAVATCLTCQVCLDYQKKYRANNKDKIKQVAAVKRQRNRLSIRSNHKAWRVSLKAEVMAAYGNKCTCCGETTKEFLSIDHIDNNGANHRRELFGDRTAAGTKFYAWLKKHSYPEGYQVLCYNCNFAKGHFGTCPHTRNVGA